MLQLTFLGYTGCPWQSLSGPQWTTIGQLSLQVSLPPAGCFLCTDSSSKYLYYYGT